MSQIWSDVSLNILRAGAEDIKMHLNPPKALDFSASLFSSV